MAVPRQEVKNLLLAAGDGSQSFHDGTRSLSRGLSGRSKQHLRGEQETVSIDVHRSTSDILEKETVLLRNKAANLTWTQSLALSPNITARIVCRAHKHSKLPIIC